MTEWHGVFGKLPEARDFVSRGLPAPVKRGFDRWLTQNVAGRGGDWPEGGLRGLFTFEVPALFVAVPSQDKVGRRFPLAALTDSAGASLEEAEEWCDAIFPVLSSVAEGTSLLEALTLALDATPLVSRHPESGEDALWTRGNPPMMPDDETLAEFGLK